MQRGGQGPITGALRTQALPAVVKALVIHQRSFLDCHKAAGMGKEGRGTAGRDKCRLLDQDHAGHAGAPIPLVPLFLWA